MAFVQAPRSAIDGPVAVKRVDDDFIVVEATTEGKTESILMTRHNASRIFGMLALMLEIPLPASIGKAISM